jgi:mono/diheme cytochrome c family protein
MSMNRRISEAISLGVTLALAQTAFADTPDQVEQGRYLAIAGNCMSCHTAAGGESFAGGVAFETPFGRLYSTNITPDPETGIGKWTLEQFTQALREGVRPDGAHLYPAFPYTAFTNVTDADAAALFAYLKSLPAVNAPAQENDMSFPFSQRWLLGLWKAMYFEPGRYQPDKSKSEEWNRGAYLVEGLGHCGACHTPRTFLGAEDADRAFHGATYKDKIDDKLLDWSASDLTSGPNGLAQWQEAELAQYLHEGHSFRAAVFGGMNEVIANSTSNLTEADTKAIAVYLKSLPPSPAHSASKPDDDVMQAGSQLYDVHCGTCHLPTGLGSEDTGPPLAGSTVALASDPATLINITLYGAQKPRVGPPEKWHEPNWKIMEAFGDKVTDEEAAALLTFIRNSWGNQAGEVSVDQVAKQR